MRQIKFRAWDKEKNAWFPFDHLEMLAIFNLHDAHFENPANRSTPNLVFMQFTGLIDKNGKEIFEGDIFKNGSLVRAITVDEQHGYRFHFGLDRLTRGDADYGTVIGNIYENPELLK